MSLALSRATSFIQIALRWLSNAPSVPRDEAKGLECTPSRCLSIGPSPNEEYVNHWRPGFLHFSLDMLIDIKAILGAELPSHMILTGAPYFRSWLVYGVGGGLWAVRHASSDWRLLGKVS